MNNIYPAPVEEVALKIFNAMKNEFKEEYPDDMKWVESVAVPYIEKIMIKKFIKGEDLVLTMEEAIDLLNNIYIYVSLEFFKKNKLVDSMEDENGETVYFLTKDGEEYCRKKFGDK